MMRILVGLGLLLSIALIARAATAPASGAQLRQRALAQLGRWVEAQNHGDVAGYVALYDQRHFKGRKRTQRGATDLEWKGWIADRTPMLKRGMTVAAEGPTVETFLDPRTKLKPGIVRLRFLQRWKSARYADHGIKVLDLLVQPDGALLILHEELLNSEPGWDAPTGGAQLDLGKVTTVDEADRALAKLGITAGNVEEMLARVPDVPQLRRLLARAILERGDLACDAILREQQCGDEIVEWEALDPKRPWSDPCVRRRAALWALSHGQLGPGDLERIADRLEPLLSAGKPEVEIPRAVLELAAHAPDALRQRLLTAALAGEHVELVASSLDGVSRGGLAALARAHLDTAALRLDPRKQRAEVLSALADDKLKPDTRAQLVHAVAELKGDDVSEALRQVSDNADDCKLAADAGVVLSRRGDQSRLPHRPSGEASAEVLSRELCRLLHDPDDTRAQKRWREFLPARGKIKHIEEVNNEFADRDEDGNRIQDKPVVTTFSRKSSTLDDLDRDIGAGETPRCDGNRCEFDVPDGHTTLEFRDGFLISITHTRWIGCGC
jgi:hypothetical protein